MRPGEYEITDSATGTAFSVVWWDPALLDRPGDDTRGLRRDDLIARDARPSDVVADRARYDTWRNQKAEVLQRAATPSLEVVTATDYVRSAPEYDLARDASPASPAQYANVTIDDCSVPGLRPSGRRFGVLVHVLLAAVPVDAGLDQIRDLALLHARVLGAPDDERDAAIGAVERALRHRLLVDARAATAAGRVCRREAPITVVRHGMLIDGQIDLVFEAPERWHIVDFKTDAELGAAEDAYRKQVVLYAEALAAITGRPAVATILRV